MMAIATPYDSTGKVVVITGGSRGLGRAMALGFAAAGATLAIASRKLEAWEATVREIRALGCDGSAHAIHVGKWADCNRLAEEVYARWGRADVLINNAGMSPLAPSSLDTSEDLFDKIIAVNLKGPFRLSALFGSRMAAGEGGDHQYLFDRVAAPEPRDSAVCGSQGRTQYPDDRLRKGIWTQSAGQPHHLRTVPYGCEQGLVAD